MHRRRFLQGPAGLLAVATASEAQQGAVPRVGNLSLASALNADKLYPEFGDASLGWIEGRNIVIEGRYAEGSPSRLLPLAEELVRMKVDVIVAAGSNPVINAVKQATSTIPIVMLAALSPVDVPPLSNRARRQPLEHRARQHQAQRDLDLGWLPHGARPLVGHRLGDLLGRAAGWARGRLRERQSGSALVWWG